MREKGLDLNKISVYREQIFGIAIISIMLFHFSADFNGAVGQNIGIGAGLKNDIIMTYFRYIRSIGVEIFTLLSGVGLYYSYSNNSNTRLFYKKRAKRLLVPYLIVAVIFWAIKDFYFLGEGLQKYIGDITFITLFTRGVHTIWYIGLMAILYVLFPIIYKMMSNQYRWIGAMVALTIAIFIPVLLFYVDKTIYHNCSIAITRIPIFVFGVFLGKEIKESKHLNGILTTIIIVGGVIIKYVNVHGEFASCISRYLDSIYACSLILLCVVVLDLLKNVNWLNVFLKKAGEYSLELYMVHVTLRNLMKEFGFDAYRISQYAIMIIIAVFVSVGLNKISSVITRKLFKS